MQPGKHPRNFLRLFKFFCVFAVFISHSSLHGQNWPGWRGTNGDGTSPETNLPVKWDSVTNVLWKSPVPGIGYSSPVVWNDRLFTLTAIKETNEKLLLCYAVGNGKLLWQKTVVKGDFESKHNDNSFASGTPTTDGKRVYVSLLDGINVVVAAFDYDGRQIWIQKPGTFLSPHGFSCSPVLFEDKVIVNCSSKGDSFLAALSHLDGHIIWKISLDKQSHSFSTPLITQMSGKMQMIFCGNKEIASYNPVDGSKYWFVNGPSEEFCSTPVYDAKLGLVFASSAWPKRILMAIKPDGQGDVSLSKVVWQSPKGAVYVPSPVCADDFLITTMASGQVHCLDAATGNVFWVEDLGKQYASPVLAGGLVYIPNDEGMITVIKPGKEFNAIAKNFIGERMYASPAVSNGKIDLRGFKYLYCIGSNYSK